MDNEVDSMIDAMKKGIDANGTDAPTMSIDPKTSQVSVVGDPNQIEHKPGNYEITFSYPKEALSEEDKNSMKFNEETGEYEATVKYYDKRVKPLYRMTVAMDLADVLSKADILLQDGSYTTEHITNQTVRVFLDNIETLARVARVVLDIPEDQLGFATPDSLIGFFNSMMFNEPNLLKEAANFLEQSYIKQAIDLIDRTKTSQSQTTQTQDTQQS